LWREGRGVEAENMQTFITRSTAADPRGKLERNKREAIEAAKARKEVLDSVTSVSTAKNDLVQTCSVFAQARASIRGDVVNGYLRAAQDFLSPSGPEDILAATAAATQVGGLLTFCGLTYDMKNFNSSATVTLNIKDTFFKAYDYSFDFGYDLFDVMPKTGDAESLKSALTNVKNISAKIDAAIKNLSTPSTDKFKAITVSLDGSENSN
jgi:hypothetical protein